MGNVDCKLKRDLTNETIFITGANTGIGKESALRFASLNANLILGCRSEERTKPILEEINKSFPKVKVEFVKLDLSDLDSVVECAKQVQSKYEKIDILLNNAGIMTPQERLTTKQNFEIQIGTNHFGHFVLTNQLLPLIKKSKQGRVVNVSSLAHTGLMGTKADVYMEDINYEKRKYDDNEAYAQSKLANVLFTKQLQQVLDSQNTNIKTVSLHPGVINTELGRHIKEKANFAMRAGFKMVTPFIKTPVQGAQTQIQCCLEEHEKLVKGAYYSDCKIKQPSKKAEDAQLAEEFWKFSNEQVKNYLIQW